MNGEQLTILCAWTCQKTDLVISDMFGRKKIKSWNTNVKVERSMPVAKKIKPGRKGGAVIFHCGPDK